MILIIGGAYQGKLDYAINEYKLNIDDICDLSKEGMDLSKRCLYHFERWVLEEIKNDNDINASLNEISGSLNDKVIISEDISSGIVPIDKTERLWREETGRALIRLSRESSNVVRLFAGIPQVLK